jgi:hypothetical protein
MCYRENEVFFLFVIYLQGQIWSQFPKKQEHLNLDQNDQCSDKDSQHITILSF